MDCIRHVCNHVWYLLKHSTRRLPRIPMTFSLHFCNDRNYCPFSCLSASSSPKRIPLHLPSLEVLADMREWSNVTDEDHKHDHFILYFKQAFFDM